MLWEFSICSRRYELHIGCFWALAAHRGRCTRRGMDCVNMGSSKPESPSIIPIVLRHSSQEMPKEHPLSFEYPSFKSVPPTIELLFPALPASLLSQLLLSWHIENVCEFVQLSSGIHSTNVLSRAKRGSAKPRCISAGWYVSAYARMSYGVLKAIAYF